MLPGCHCTNTHRVFCHASGCRVAVHLLLLIAPPVTVLLMVLTCVVDVRHGLRQWLDLVFGVARRVAWALKDN